MICQSTAHSASLAETLLQPRCVTRSCLHNLGLWWVCDLKASLPRPKKCQSEGGAAADKNEGEGWAPHPSPETAGLSAEGPKVGVQGLGVYRIGFRSLSPD